MGAESSGDLYKDAPPRYIPSVPCMRELMTLRLPPVNR